MILTRGHASNLTPEELESAALEQVECMFREFRAGCDVVRERCNPLNLVKRSLLLDAGLAGSAAFMLVRHMRRKQAGRSKDEAREAAPGTFDSVMSAVAGAASRALPGLLACWLGRECSKAEPPPR